MHWALRKSLAVFVCLAAVLTAGTARAEYRIGWQTASVPMHASRYIPAPERWASGDWHNRMSRFGDFPIRRCPDADFGPPSNFDDLAGDVGESIGEVISAAYDDADRLTSLCVGEKVYTLMDTVPPIHWRWDAFRTGAADHSTEGADEVIDDGGHWLARRTTDPVQYIHDRIEEFRVYDHSLTPNEIDDDDNSFPEDESVPSSTVKIGEPYPCVCDVSTLSTGLWLTYGELGSAPLLEIVPPDEFSTSDSTSTQDELFGGVPAGLLTIGTIPEPSTWVLAVLGLLGFAVYGRSRKR